MTEGALEEGRRRQLLRDLAELVEILDLDVAPAEPGDGWEGRRRFGHALRRAARKGPLVLPVAAFDTLMKTAVYEPDPSFSRWWVEPALNAFGRRRVRAVLLDHLRTGTDLERGGAARAWYWSLMSLKLPDVTAEECRPEEDDESVLTAEWCEAALREFVSNEHVVVRCSLIGMMPLRKEYYPPELHDLVDTALAIARSHPNSYIRNRVATPPPPGVCDPRIGPRPTPGPRPPQRPIAPQ